MLSKLVSGAELTRCACSGGINFELGPPSGLTLFYRALPLKYFKLLEENDIRLCATDAIRSINRYVADSRLDPQTTFFETDAEGVMGGTFPCTNELTGTSLEIMFHDSPDHGQASLAIAITTLDGIGRAAEIEGYVETAVIIIFKRANPTPERFGAVVAMSIITNTIDSINIINIKNIINIFTSLKFRYQDSKLTKKLKKYSI